MLGKINLRKMLVSYDYFRLTFEVSFSQFKLFNDCEKGMSGRSLSWDTLQRIRSSKMN